MTDIYFPQPAAASSEANQNLSAIHERIQGLAPRLIAYSRFINSPELDQEDVQQEMYAALLERGAKDPDFAGQRDAYLVRYATWSAKHAASRTYTYDSHVQRETLEGADPLETITDYTTDPAEIVERNLQLESLIEQLQALSPENQTVVKMIYLGYSESEISDELHISRPAVSQRKKTIQSQISATA